VIDYYDAIYLSPHLDDAALSCGGQIYQQGQAGQSVLIVSVTAGDPDPGDISPLAEELHESWQLSVDVVAARRREDKAACAILGADYVHWDFLDCIYRRHPASGEPLYSTEKHIFGQFDLADSALVDRVAEHMSRLPRHGAIYLPLTVGNHVDHQLVLLAARRWHGRETSFYYEDFPYVRTAGALTAALGDEAEWRQHVIPISPAALEARVGAIACYQSQIDILFGSPGQIREQVAAQVTAAGGERYWQKLSNSPKADLNARPS
jgi:LmbE family N-acetylglucosaminyl deacetylase